MTRVALEDKTYIKRNFFTCAEDRPLIVQFCGNDPEVISKACELVQDRCNAVDINLGCPQGIARKGHYGSFLLESPDVILGMVRKMSFNLTVPVCCKIRILPEKAKSLDLCQKIEQAGCSILTVHGRTKEQNKHKVGNCDWEIIKQIKELAKIPIFSNGGVHYYEDVVACFEATGVDGVMSAEALLENPALFSGKLHDLDKLASEYLELWGQYNGQRRWLKPHLFKILHRGLKENTDLRSRLGQAREMPDFRAVVNELAERRKGVLVADKFGWYERYQSYNKPNRGGKGKGVEKKKGGKVKLVVDGDAKGGAGSGKEGLGGAGKDPGAELGKRSLNQLNGGENGGDK